MSEEGMYLAGVLLTVLLLGVFGRCNNTPQPQPSPSPTATPCSVPPDGDTRWLPLEPRDAQLGPLIKSIQQSAIPQTDDAMIAALILNGHCAGHFADSVIIERADGVWEEHRPTASFGGWRSNTFCDQCSLWELR